MNVKSRLLDFVSYTQLSRRKFQERIGVSNSYIQNISESIGADVMNRISIQFPELNTSWLLTGEGSMLKNTSTSSNTAEERNGNNVNISLTLDKAIDEIAEQRKLVAKSQEQMDRLIAIIENMQK
jgi:hypothetical protein